MVAAARPAPNRRRPIRAWCMVRFPWVLHHPSGPFRSRPCWSGTEGEKRMPGSDRIEVARDARGVATVTIANAAKLNTLNRAVMRDLIAAVEALAADSALRAVV